MTLEVGLIIGIVTLGMGLITFMSNRALKSKSEGEEAGAQKKDILYLQAGLDSTNRAIDANSLAVRQMEKQFTDVYHGIDKSIDQLARSIDDTNTNISRFESKITDNMLKLEGEVKSLEHLTTTAIASATEANSKASKLHKRVDRIEEQIKIKEEK